MTNTPPATIHLGDCIEVMRTLPENSVDAVITDPPYGLGFMGKAWDELPPGEEWARECLRVLKPGGHLLAFGGSRTWHRLAVAVEDAGFEVRDSIAWLYGSGFPKSLNVAVAVDKLRAADARAQLLPDEARFCAWMRDHSGLSDDDARRLLGSARFLTGVVEIVNTATAANPRMGRRAMVPTAAAWEKLRPLLAVEPPAWVESLVKAPPTPQSLEDWNPGKGRGTSGGNEWAGFGTALKPAFEPIVVARKPLVGTVAANVLAHGTGALNIDGCRVAGEPWKTKGAETGIRSVMIHDGAEDADSRADIMFREKQERSGNPAGRWPANVVLDESQAAALDQQSGERRDGVATNRRRSPDELASDAGWGFRKQTEDVGYGGGGGASRFFPVFKGDDDDALSVLEAAIDNATDMCRCGHGAGHCNTCAARAVMALVEPAATFKYQAKAPTSERIKVDGIAHPTVKPLALMRWLVRLVTPPGGTVLEPFAGSGTTVEACALEGFACIAIEREPDYLPLIQARLARVEAAQSEPAGPSLFDIEATA